MMLKRVATLFLAVAVATMGLATANAAIIAGWNQNGNAEPLAGDGFGFSPSDFPQPNDHGPVGSTHSINAVNATTDGNGLYTKVDSFAGTTNNDLAAAGAGGSFSFVGGSSNGSQSIFSVPTTGYTDILVSWSQRGTSTGYTSRVFEYSSDGGSNWTDIGAYNHTDATAASSGALGATFKTVALDLSGVSALNNDSDVMFRMTFDGAATGGADSGNNRWDNFYVEGTVVPEPASIMLLGLAAFGWAAFARRK